MVHKKTILALSLVFLLIAAGFSYAVVSNIPNTPNPSQATATAHATPPVVTFIPPTFIQVTSAPFTTVGISVADKTLTILDGDAFALSDYQGKIVILNFWATWCIPCITEMPELQAYVANLPENVVLLAVTDPTNSQTIDDIRTFLAQYKITELTIALDQHMGLHAALGVQVLPATYFVDANGVIQREWIGQITRADLEQIIGEMTSGQP